MYFDSCIEHKHTASRQCVFVHVSKKIKPSKLNRRTTLSIHCQIWLKPTFKLLVYLNFRSQYLQEYGKMPLWQRICTFKSCVWRNRLSHTLHASLLNSSWHFEWLCNCCFVLNLDTKEETTENIKMKSISIGRKFIRIYLPSHCLHAKFFSFECVVCKWPLRFPFVLNFLPHWSQTKLNFSANEIGNYFGLVITSNALAFPMIKWKHSLLCWSIWLLILHFVAKSLTIKWMIR